jgi:cell division protein FtsW
MGIDARTFKTDIPLLVLCTSLLLFGLILLTSASAPVGLDRFGDSYFFIKRQLLYGVIPGLVLFFVALRLRVEQIERVTLPVFGFVIFLMLLVFVPGIGSSFDTGNRSWITLFGFSLQPSEILKLALILFSAWYLSRKKNLTQFEEGFFPSLCVLSIPLVLVIAQSDIGTASVLFVIIVSLLFFAGSRLSHIGFLCLIGLVGIGVLIAVAPYRVARFTTFLHPELDPQGQGYHINQAYLAIGSGGLFGRGLGHSLQKFQYLPEVHADSIFAVLAEEMGFIFCVLFLVLLISIIIRMFQVARLQQSRFASLSIAGIATWIATQSFLNIGAIVGLLPLTGVPLPFVSHGGTALMTMMAGVGIVLSFSKHV